MSRITRFIQRIIRSMRSDRASIPERARYGIPTVKFDSSRVTDAVKADLAKNIALLEDINKRDFGYVFDAALKAISVGGDLGSLADSLMTLDGMTRRRAADISRSLWSRAYSIIKRQEWISLGIENGIWRYSGASCMSNPSEPSEMDIKQNSAHQAADGTKFDISKGLFLNGKWTWPGGEDSCKCFCRPIILGIDRE